MEQFKFTKMNGTGNDFIVFDNRLSQFKGNETDFFRAICQRRFSIGADGILLLNSAKNDLIEMQYFNRDGREADMCANGLRCIAYYAGFNKIIKSDSFTVKAGDGLHSVKIKDNIVSVSVNLSSKIHTGLKLKMEPEFTDGGFIEVGVPHYIIFSKNIDTIDIENKAQYYRHHKKFSHGTNVNFVQIVDTNKIKVRTYERGVEHETLSCGTGCVASVLSAADHFSLISPVKVKTKGGTLEVDFDRSWNNVSLTAEVQIAYEGFISPAYKKN